MAFKILSMFNYKSGVSTLEFLDDDLDCELEALLGTTGSLDTSAL